MTTSHRSKHCAELTALLNAAEAQGASEEAAAVLSNHVALCAMCAAAEQRLASLMAQYDATQTPALPEALEQRLLSIMLDKHCGSSEPE